MKKLLALVLFAFLAATVATAQSAAVKEQAPASVPATAPATAPAQNVTEKKEEAPELPKELAEMLTRLKFLRQELADYRKQEEEYHAAAKVTAAAVDALIRKMAEKVPEGWSLDLRTEKFMKKEAPAKQPEVKK